MPIQVSQFSDRSIPMSQALSLCGPAAAIAFARANGRNPTLTEARDLATSVGWTEGAGMAGPGSQKALLAKMGIQADLTPAADWGRVAQDVQAGKPVIISTPRHYFTVSAVDADGRYFVGTSGTDLKGGREWMTAAEITAAGRGVNGALHMTEQPSGAAAPPPSPPTRAEQQFLEANSPNAPPIRPPATPAPAPKAPRVDAPAPTTEVGRTAVAGPEPMPDDHADEMGRPTRPRTAPQTVPEWLRREMAQSAYSQHLMGQFEEPQMPAFRLPGLPELPGFRTPSPFTLGGR